MQPLVVILLVLLVLLILIVLLIAVLTAVLLIAVLAAVRAVVVLVLVVLIVVSHSNNLLLVFSYNSSMTQNQLSYSKMVNFYFQFRRPANLKTRQTKAIGIRIGAKKINTEKIKEIPSKTTNITRSTISHTGMALLCGRSKAEQLYPLYPEA